jgi:YggT family protein
MENVMLRQITVAVAMVLGTLLNAYWWIVVARVLLSWVNADPYNPIVRFLYNATDPVLYWVRRRLPFVVVSGWDLSPLVVLLVVRVLQVVVVDSLYELAYRIAAISTAVLAG